MGTAPQQPLSWLGLTEAQAGLWYAQRLDPGNPVFNTGQFITLRGKLDLGAFRAALSQAVAEAEALCLRFEERGGQPVQAIDPRLRPRVEVIDLSADPEGEAKARAAMRRDMDTPRGLKGEALAAERIYRLGPERHLWYQRVHHLAVDAFGTELITRRTAALYAERLGGPEAGSPPPGLEAALGEDAAYRASPKREADAAHWREAMAGLGEVASLVPGAAPSGRHAIRLAHAVESGVAERLRARAEATALPWPDILSALIGAYVRRHAGGGEVAIGLGFMSRLGSPAARLPCMLMNVLPVRLPVPEEAPLGEFLVAAAKRFARARRHGRYRGEQIRRDLHRVGGRGGAGGRLYGALVNILPFEEAPDFPGLATEIEILGTGPVDDITITLRGDARASRLRLELEANPALYDAAALAVHAERLLHFLGAALAAQRLADVPTATPAEAKWALRTLNATAHPVPDTTLAALIEQRMAGTPGAIALEGEGRRLTYAELERRSRALALELRARGAGPGSIVAVALDRSLALEIALVAILRAGAAYLPLDLSHPPARIARILASAQPVLALAPPGQPALAGLPCLPPESWQLDSEASLPPGPEPGDLAYLLYTSGSTGEPKGVMVEHRAIVNRLEWMRRHYGFGPGDRVLQKTPMTFDVSVWEFFLPLLSGATLVMAPPGAHKDPAALAALIRDGGITTAHFVPSMLAAFLAEPAARGLSLARVFCSGEALPPELRDRFHATLRAELHNLYGPTEAAVDVSFWPAGPEDRSRPVPIGFPVWNTRLYVLDEALRPLPAGVAGPLFIAGRQLARGYLGRDDLTEAAFIPDPFHPGERIYRTGDLASLRPDGAILFHGRADDQVKLRGLRIELGEIEAALATAPGVAQGRVVAREDRPGDQRLVAYLVPGPGYAPEAVRAHVAARVPDYMLPSAFVALECLPVNGSGKLDRRALPAPDYGGEAGREPATETERRLAALFAEALGLPRVGAEDDFFALGGHSLLAVEMTLRIREEWGWDPGLGAIFEHPDVAGLARVIDEGARVADTGLGPLIRLSDGDPALPPLFVVHPAGGISWCYGSLARALSPRRVVYGLQAPALDMSQPLPESLDALAADYAARILAVRPDEGEKGVVHLLGWSVGGIIAQAMAVRLRALGHPVGLVALLDAYPADVWRDQPDPGPEGGLRALLAIAGHDPERLPPGLASDGALTRDAVTAFLRQGDSPLGRLPEAALDGVVRVVQANNRLVRGHRHGRFDGRLTHIRAARDHGDRPEIRPDLWRPYAARLEVLDMPALHQELVGGRIVAQLAPLLAERMAGFETGGESGCAAAE